MAIMRIREIALVCFGLALISVSTNAAPQAAEEAPMPYEYQYEVKDQEKNLFHNKQEAGDASGAVTGKYQVLLADGRLMTVEYTVSGESGFVPKISFEDGKNPF